MQTFFMLYLSLYKIHNKPEIKTKWDLRDLETNLQAQSRKRNSM